MAFRPSLAWSRAFGEPYPRLVVSSGVSPGFLESWWFWKGFEVGCVLALALDASREIRVALQALGLPHRRATSTVSPYSVPFVTVAWGAVLPWDTGIVDMIFSQKLSIISKSLKSLGKVCVKNHISL